MIARGLTGVCSGRGGLWFGDAELVIALVGGGRDMNYVMERSLGSWVD